MQYSFVESFNGDECLNGRRRLVDLRDRDEQQTAHHRNVVAEDPGMRLAQARVVHRPEVVVEEVGEEGEDDQEPRADCRMVVERYHHATGEHGSEAAGSEDARERDVVALHPRGVVSELGQRGEAAIQEQERDHETRHDLQRGMVSVHEIALGEGSSD
jgi:hypothetical protein